MATVELKEHEWKAFSEAEYAVIDCYGDFCVACMMLEPIFDAVAGEMPGIQDPGFEGYCHCKLYYKEK